VSAAAGEFGCPHCHAGARFVRCPRCSVVVVGDTAWSSWRCLTCGAHHLHRVDSTPAVTAAEHWKTSGGKARAGVRDPTLQNPEVRARLQQQIATHRLQREGQCLLCGYSGSMAICHRSRALYANPWVWVPLAFVGVGLIFILAMILFSPTKDFCVCPACEAAIVFK